MYSLTNSIEKKQANINKRSPIFHDKRMIVHYAQANQTTTVQHSKCHHCQLESGQNINSHNGRNNPVLQPLAAITPDHFANYGFQQPI